jgi:hypothetical protein
MTSALMEPSPVPKMEKPDSVAFLVPTRNRVPGVVRFINSIINTTSDIERVCIYFYVDEDDTSSQQFFSELEGNNRYKDLVKYKIGPRIILSQMVNELYPLTKESILYFGADDLEMKTEGWDRILYKFFAQLSDNIAVAFADDLATFQHPEGLATHPIFHRDWVNVLGYVSPPYFACDYADTWLSDLAKGVNRLFKLPFINEHHHFSVNKSPYDSTYAESRNKFVEQGVTQKYMDTEEERQQDIQKLKKYMRGFSK